MRTCAAPVPAETIRSVTASRGCPFRWSRAVLRTPDCMASCISVCAISVASRLWGLRFARIRWSSARTRLHPCLRFSRRKGCQQGNRQSDCRQKTPGPMAVRQFAFHLGVPSVYFRTSDCHLRNASSTLLRGSHTQPGLCSSHLSCSEDALSARNPDVDRKGGSRDPLLRSQSSNLFFLVCHCDVSVQISARGKYDWLKLNESNLRMLSELLFRLPGIATRLCPDTSDHVSPSNLQCPT
jgi:hypothetical protein